MREQLSVARNDQLCLRGGHRAAAMDHRALAPHAAGDPSRDRKSTRLNSSHSQISYAVFCLKKKKEVDGMYVGLEGYKLQITGGREKGAFRRRQDVSGPRRKRLLVSGGGGLPTVRAGDGEE